MKKNGFTLLELIIVVAIIGIFAVVIMPIINGNWANNQQQSRKAHVTFENGVWQSCANGSCYPIDNPHVFQQETESE